MDIEINKNNTFKFNEFNYMELYRALAAVISNPKRMNCYSSYTADK